MSFFYSDNPILDAERHQAALDRRLAELPVYDNCDNPIQGHYYEVNGGNICPECLETYFRKDADCE